MKFLQTICAGFILLIASACCFIASSQQTSPSGQPLQPPAQPHEFQTPHVSAITPPPIPYESPFLRRAPSNLFFFTVTAGKTAQGYLVAPMTLEELTQRFLTNRHNLYLIELREIELADPVTVEYTNARIIVTPIPK
jgi:hypothetical protein